MTRAEVEVATLDDPTVEILRQGEGILEEAVRLNLSRPGRATIAADGHGIGVILDDDFIAPTLIFSVDQPTVTESDSDADVMVMVTATLGSGQLAPRQLPNGTISWGADGDTAMRGTDYTVTDRDIDFPEDSRSATFSYTLNLKGDNVDEGAETITVGATNPFPDDISYTVPATITILDDDGDEMTSNRIRLSLSQATVEEDVATAPTVTVTAELDGPLRDDAATAVMVTVGGSGSTAVSGTDYMAVPGFTVTIDAMMRSATHTFELTPTNDMVDEPPESIIVSGTTDATGVAVMPATLSLLDDDRIPNWARLSVTPDPVSEDGGTQMVTVTATLVGSVTRSVDTEVTVAVGGEGDSAEEGTDYTMVEDFMLTIDAGMPSGTGTFMLIPTPDVLFEGAEELGVSGSARLDDVHEFFVASTTLTLSDGETAPDRITLSVTSPDPARVSEDGGTQMVTVTATLDGSATLPVATRVAVEVGGGTSMAVAGLDYAPVPGLRIPIPAGTSSGMVTFALSPLDDELAEGDESIVFSGTFATFGGSALSITVDSATFTLEDDDDGPAGPCRHGGRGDA